MNTDDNLKEEHKRIFSKKLNYYMQLNHKQQDDIVNDLGINKSTISTWCRGIKMPRVNAIQLLADYFGVSIADFLVDETSNVSNNPNRNKLTINQQELFDTIVQLDDDKIRLAIRILHSILDEKD